MFRFAKYAAIFFLALAVFAAPVAPPLMAADELPVHEATGAEMAADLLLVRPVGAIALAAGTLLFVVASPFAALGGNIDEAAEQMVKKPFQFTFKRRLGDF